MSKVSHYEHTITTYNFGHCRVHGKLIQPFLVWRRGHMLGRNVRTSAMRVPSGLVSRPTSSIAPRLYKYSSALSSIRLGGGVMKSNRTILSIPRALSWRTKRATSERHISGGVVGARVAKAASGYRRMHLPVDVRPARPARWFADARLVGVTRRMSMSVCGLKTRILTNPQSTTYRMPSIVTLASAMLVETITLRDLGGVTSNMASCSSFVSPACSGIGSKALAD